MTSRDAIVIGAGPAGLATGLALKDAGARPLIVDSSDAVASSWRSRYDRLRLNTCRPMSHLPGRRFPKGVPMFPTRDELVDHLERHAAEDGLEFQLGNRVSSVDRNGAGWVLGTAAGRIDARQVVVATGYEGKPKLPDWTDRFSGSLVHSSEYRNPDPFSALSVLVVGSGSSGMEIAHDLASGGASKVWLSTRTPPNILLREGPGGIPGDMIAVALLHLPRRVSDAVARLGRKKSIGDLSEYGLPVPDEGVFTRLDRLGVAPAIVDMEVIDAIRDGSIEVVPAVESARDAEVELSDGRHLAPDAVVCATGFRRGLQQLVGHLGVLDERERPRAVGAEAAEPGLRFIGYVPRPAGLGYMAKQAKRAAKAIMKDLRTTARS